MRYHGHQFGVYNPEIGDGRGFLFAQCRQEATGRVLDLGTKGSGRTPYARTADGRLTLKGAVREILATEMLTALNVPTSQTFCVIETGESLDRQDEPSPTRSAVLTRMLHSHIRIGSFQRLAYLRQQENLEILLRHTIKYYYPDLDSQANLKELIPDFLGQFAAKIARMVAGWMAAGFVHGVLNTDNFNITGESFDYGPWRFLPAMQPVLLLLILTSKNAMPMDDSQKPPLGALPACRLFSNHFGCRGTGRGTGRLLVRGGNTGCPCYLLAAGGRGKG